jgi:hypothetical protein
MKKPADTKKQKKEVKFQKSPKSGVAKRTVPGQLTTNQIKFRRKRRNKWQVAQFIISRFFFIPDLNLPSFKKEKKIWPSQPTRYSSEGILAVEYG